MKKLLITTCLFVICSSFGPPNRNLYKNNPDCYQACIEAEYAIMHRQGSKESQIHFDKSIALCPTFEYSFYEKGVPYVKRGQNADWKPLIDRAVELKPKEFLMHRGWCNYMFLHNYQAALDDIDELERITEYDLGMTGDGNFHLNIIRALCYRGLGDTTKAIEMIEKQVNQPDYDAGLYDYFYLGVMYWQTKQYNKSHKAFLKQKDLNDVADVNYYLALTYNQLGDYEAYRNTLLKALNQYEKSEHIYNGYRHYEDEVFKSDITTEMEKAGIRHEPYCLPHKDGE